jgi:hypothetical protein
MSESPTMVVTGGGSAIAMQADTQPQMNTDTRRLKQNGLSVSICVHLRLESSFQQPAR